MQELSFDMDFVLWGATLVQWGVLLGVWLIATLCLMVLRRALRGRLKRFADASSSEVRGYLNVVIERTKLFFLAAIGLHFGALVAALPAGITSGTATIAFLAFLVQLVLWFNGLLARYVTKYREDYVAEDAAAVTTVQAMGFIARLVVYSLAFLLAVDNLGYEVTTLLAGLGIGGIAVALALQNILGDLFASLSIVLDKPFVVGDFLIVGDLLGTVEYIGLKTTRLRSLSGEQLVFSNSDLLNSRIRNFKRMFERRVVFDFSVVYQTPYDKIKEIPVVVQAIVESQEDARFDRAHFKEYGDSGLIFEVVFFVLVPDFNTYMDIQEQINLAIFREFEDREISFAYPTRTVHMEQAPVAAAHAGNGNREN